MQQMLEILTAQQVPVKLCKTCADGRGVSALPLVDGVEVGTLVELAQWTLAADKVLTFRIWGFSRRQSSFAEQRSLVFCTISPKSSSSTMPDF